MISTFLSNYFGFNRQQRNGLFVLITISFILLVFRIVYPYFIIPDSIDVKQLPLIPIQSAQSALSVDSAQISSNNVKSKTGLFPFNPNTVNTEQLLLLGFNEKTAKRLIKFRNKGFKFKIKKDLLKVYGVSDVFYYELEPYILITEKNKTTIASKEISKFSKNVKQNSPKTELNSADSLALIAIKGIGPSFAKRILKYRQALGGFVQLEQLKEVYGFTDEMYQKISPVCTVNPQLVRKLNMNKDEFKLINKHPYITYELTKSIFDWRRKTTITAQNLKGILNDDILYEKLLPYLSFD